MDEEVKIVEGRKFGDPQHVLSVKDTGNKATPKAVDAKVVFLKREVPISGAPSIPLPINTPGILTSPEPVGVEPLVGNVPRNEVGLHGEMVKNFHTWLSKVQLLSHSKKDKIVELAKEVEKLL
jgi:hypothetical protein